MTQNRANFNRKTARFRRRKCAQRTTKARRVNAHALHAVWHTPATSVKLLQALGACRAQKSRRISSKFSRFSPKIASFRRRLSCKKQRRAQEKLRVLRNVQQTIIHIILMQRACVGGRNRADFQIFSRKIARTSTAKLRDFGAESARNAQQKRAESMHMPCTPCGTRLQLL